MSIKKYQDFIVEKIGIALPVLELSKYVSELLLKQIKSDSAESTIDVDFLYEYLKDIYDNGTINYADFPVDSIRCKLNIKFKDRIRSKLSRNFVLSGYFLNPETDLTKDQTSEEEEYSSLSHSKRIEGTKGINLFISITADIKHGHDFKNDPEFIKALESTVIHEMTHAYETHHRGPKMPIKYSMVYTKDRKYKVWNTLINLIYQCQGFEINAKVAELYPYRHDKDFSKQYSFYVLKGLKMFNAEEFLRKLQNNIMTRDDISRASANRVIRKLINEFINRHIKVSKGFKENPIAKIVNLTINDNKVSSIMRFLNHWDKIFHMKAIPFERKLQKLKSI